MRKSFLRASLGLWLLLLLGQMLAARPALADAPPPLDEERIEIVGLTVQPSPAAQAVPRNTGTLVMPLLVRSDRTEPGGELPTLPDDAIFLAELRGPAFGAPVPLSARPNEPFVIPPLALEGQYTLDNIRLVSADRTLLEADPSSAAIEVLDQLLVSQVTTRPLTTEEIRARGIVVDQENFKVVNFTVAFGLEDERVTVDFPILMPNNSTLPYPALPALPAMPHLGGAEVPSQQFPSLPTLGIQNISMTGFELTVPTEDEALRELVKPIPGAVIIPGNIAYLNQFFSVILKVSNTAPGYSNLVVRNLRAEIILPDGEDRVGGTGDDPLRMARLGEPPAPQPRTQPVVQPGPDGELGTSDDILTVGPQQSGDAEYLVEGLREGVHSVEMKITGTLVGLPVGPIEVTGRARGVVEVRDPTFALTLNHPATVTAGEEYDFLVTVTNVSEAPANLLSLSLLPRLLSGATLVSGQTVAFETVAPGDSATATFRLRAQKTGNVTATSIASEGVPGRFEFRMAVGELGIPLSPNTLVLPRVTNSLPTAWREASVGFLGQGYALATAPVTPRGLMPLGRDVIYARARELAAAAQRISMGEPLPAAARDLALDFLGNGYTRIPERFGADQLARQQLTQRDYRGFDALLRQSRRGAALMDLFAEGWGGEVAAGGALAFQEDFAAAVASRPGHISAIVGAAGGPAPVALQLTDPVGRQVGVATRSGTIAREVPFATFFTLRAAGPRADQLALVAVPQPGAHQVALVGTASGTFDLGLVVPEGSGLRRLTYTGVAIQEGGRARLRFTVGGTNDFLLEVDSDGDGAADLSLPPTTNAPVEDLGPRVIGAVQYFTGNKDSTRYGQVVGVLFSEEVSLASSQSELPGDQLTHYQAEANRVGGVLLQPGGRVVMLGLRDGVGHTIPRAITLSGIEDRLLNPMATPTATVAITPTVDITGGVMRGTVRRADGTPVPRALIRFSHQELDPFDRPYWQLVTVKHAAEDGTYQFDYVQSKIAMFEYFDPETGEFGRALGYPRHQDDILQFDLIFPGTATLLGQTLDPEGNPLPGALVRVTNPLAHDSQRQGTSDAEGNFIIPRVPVGTVSIEAVQSQERLQLVTTGVLTEAGGMVRQTLTLLPVDQPQTFGTLVGQLFRSDGVTPAEGVPVYTDRGGVSVTDAEGRYRIERLPLGGLTVRGLDVAQWEQATTQTTILPDRAVTANLILVGGTGTVEGTVLEADGSPAVGVVIRGGWATQLSDAQGRFTLQNLPVGPVSASATDEATSRAVAGAATIAYPGDTAQVQLQLPGLGGIAGRVTTAEGTPVANLEVWLLGPRILSTVTNATGGYQFDNLPLGPYLVSAFRPDFSDGNVANVRLVFHGELRQVNVAFKGRGTVEGVVFDDDGVTPLGARVGLSELVIQRTLIRPAENPECLPDIQVGGTTIELPDCKEVGVSFAFIRRTRIVNSDISTGVFRFPNVFVGDFLAEAANAFSPGVVSVGGQIPQAGATVPVTLTLQATGVVTGTVFQPDGTTPVGAGVVVRFDSSYLSDVRVATDEAGTFEFPLINPGGFLLSADDGAGLVGQSTGNVQSGQTIGVPVRLLRTGTVTVRVRGASGLVAGATVTLQEAGFPRGQRTGLTGPDGTLTFEGGDAVHEGNFSVYAAKGGVSGQASSQMPSLTVSPAGQVQIEVTLHDDAGTVVGRFQRPDGTPIPNALVTLASGAGQSYWTTNPAGEFHFEGVPQGTFSLLAWDPASGRRGHASGTVAAHGETVTVTLLPVPLGTVTGMVRRSNDGVPITGASVVLAVNGPTGAVLRTTSGTAGTFSLPGVPAGSFSLSASDPTTGFGGWVQGTLTSEGQVVEQDITVQIPTTGRVEGYVTDAGGQPVTTGQVLFIRGNSTLYQTTVDNQGFFTIEGVPLGPFRLLARPGAGSDAGGAAGELTFDGETAHVDVQLVGTGTVTGLVMDRGQPVANARVDLARRSSEPAAYADYAFSDASGRFTFTQVLAGEFSASARQPATNLGATGTGTLVAGGTLSLTLNLEPSGSVVGRVLRPAGTPAPSMAVELTNGDVQRYGTTTSDGTFAFSSLKLGTYQLQISDPQGEGLARATLTLTEAGQVVDLGDLLLDLAPPTVAATLPAAGAMGVPVTTTIAVRFSEPIAPATLTATNLEVRSPQGVVAGSWTLHEAGTSARFTRTVGAYPDLERITLRVRRGVTDLVGRPLAAESVVAFTTADTTPPTIADQSPARSGTEVALDSVVRITFNEAVDPSAFADPSRAITLRHGEAEVAGQVAFLFGNTVAVLTPDQPLQPDSLYQVTIQAASDQHGNRQAEATTFSFHTLDLVAPVIQALSSSAGSPVRVGTATTIAAQLEQAPDIASVAFFVNGALRATATSAPYSFVLPITEELGSTVVLTARATDRSGNVSPTRTLTLAVAADLPPTVAILVPAPDGEVLSGESVTLVVRATDDWALRRLYFQATGAVQASQVRELPAASTSVTQTFTLTIPAAATPGSTVQLRVSALDTLNQPSPTVSVTVRVRDVTRPSVQIVAPPAGTVVEPGATLPVTLRATDNGAVAALRLRASGAASLDVTEPITPAAMPITRTILVPVSSSALPTETLTLVAEAQDGAGNESAPVTLTLAIRDRVAPAVQLHLPEGVTDVVAGQSLAVTVSATDHTLLTSLGLEATGALQLVQERTVVPPSRTASTSFELTVPLTATAGSTLTLAASAQDALGNMGAAGLLSLPVVQDSPPTVSITAPQAGTLVLPGRPLTVTVGAADDVALGTIELVASGAFSASHTVTVTPTATTHTATFVLDVPQDAPPGTLALLARATDARQQRGSSQPLALEVVDVQPPAVTISAPVTGTAVVPGRTFTVTVAVADNRAVRRVELDVSGAFRLQSSQVISPTQQALVVTFPITVPATAAPQVPLILTARAEDARYNSTLSAPVQLMIRDITPPSASLATNGLTITPGSLLTFTVAAGDNVAVAALGFEATGAFQAAENRMVQPPQQGLGLTFSAQVPLTVTLGDTLTLVGRARDVAGNLTTTAPRTLTVVPPPHWIQGTVYGGGVPIAGAEVTVIGPSGRYTATTEASGDYRVDGLVPGALTLRVYDPATDIWGSGAGALGANEAGKRFDLFLPPPPTITLTGPISGTTLIEGTPLTLTAASTSEAGIAAVGFYIGGSSLLTDTEAPWVAATTVPTGSTQLVLAARVVDGEGNRRAAAPVVVTVVPDSRTTVVGRVVDDTQTPVSGATVSVGALTTTTGSDGRFTIPQVPTIDGPIQVTARAQLAGRPLRGASPLLLPVPGGVTEVGDIRIRVVKLWDGGGNTPYWDTPANWSDDALPSSSDDVYVPTGATVTFRSGTVTVRSLTSDGAFTVTGGTLLLTELSELRQALTVSGGTLDGSGAVRAAQLTWSAGTMQGSGLLEVGALTLAPTTDIYLNRTLRLTGTGTWVSGAGELGIRNSGVLAIGAGATLEVGVSRLIYHHNSGGGPGPRVQNSGTLRRTTGTGTFIMSVPFENAGTTSVEAGTLRLSGASSHTGSVNVAVGATLEFPGATHLLGTGSTLMSAGKVDFAGGTVTSVGQFDVAGETLLRGGTLLVEQPAHSTRIIMSGGTLDGSGAYTVDQLTWSAGTMQGSGLLEVGGLTLAPTADIYLNRTLRLTGTGTWVSGAGELGIRNSGVLAIGAGATLEVGVSRSIYHHNSGGGPGPRVQNSGTLRRTTGTGTFTMGVLFENMGATIIDVGTLRQTGSLQNGGGLTLAAGTVLEFPSGTHLLGTGSTLMSAGKVDLAGGTVTIAGQFDVAGETLLRGGTVLVEQPAHSARATVSGGTLDGSARFSVDDFTWTGGTMQGSGLLEVGGLTLAPTADIYLNRTLRLTGTGTWVSGAGELGIRNSGVLAIGAGATLEVGVSRSIYHHNSGGGPGPRVQNSGTLRRTAGTGVFAVSTFFENMGSTSVEAGTLRLSGSSSHTGSVNVAAGTTLEVTGGTHQWAASSSVVGTGSVAFTGGVTTVAGQYALSLQTRITSGTVTFTGEMGGSGGELLLSNGTAAFNTGEPLVWQALTQSGGTLDGSDTLQVQQLFWHGGTQTGLGTTQVLTLTLAPSSDLYLDRTLRLTGAGTYAGTGSLGIRNRGLLAVAPGATLALEGNRSIWWHNAGTGPGPRVQNAGIFRRASGAAVFTMGVPFENSGSLTVEMGSVQLAETSSHTGSVNVAAGATLEFYARSHQLAASSSLAGSGTVVFRVNTTVAGQYAQSLHTRITGETATFTGELVGSGGDLVITGGAIALNSGEPATWRKLTQSGGTLDGSDTLRVEEIAWSGGTQMGTGATEVITLTLVTSNDAYLGRTLRLSGVGTLSGTSDLGMRNSGLLVVEPGATFAVEGDRSIWWHNAGSGPGPRVQNGGTFRRTSGSGLARIAASFVSSGTLSIESGTFNLANTSSHTGSVTVGAGTMLELAGGSTYQFHPGSYVGGVGSVLFGGGSATIAGEYETRLLTRVSGANVTFTGDLVGTEGALTLATGSATFSTGAPVLWQTLTQLGGTMQGADPIQAQQFTWLGGTQGGTGTTQVLTLTLAPATDAYLERTLRLMGSGTFTGSTDLGMRNSGLLVVEPGATFAIEGDRSIWWHNAGTGPGPRVQNAGTFRRASGAGQISIAAAFTNNGVLSVEAGKVTFPRGFTQESSGSLTYLLAGPTGASDQPQVLITGQATLAGTLHLVRVNGYEPALGDTLTLMTYGSRAGQFATVLGASIGTDRRFQSTYGATALTVQVVPN